MSEPLFKKVARCMFCNKDWDWKFYRCPKCGKPTMVITVREESET